VIARLAYSLPHYARAAIRMNPALLGARLVARAGFGRSAAVRRATLLANPALMEPGRIERLFSLLVENARAHLGWDGIDLKGRRVLEVGCGPLAGFAPLAVMRGASAYEGFDPAWDAAVFAHPRLTDRFLRPAHAHIAAGIENAMDFNRFQAEFERTSEFTTAGIEARRPAEPADLVLSLSCLEHIGDVAGAFAALAAATGPGTRHLHLVNFSNHQSKARPFDNLYDLHPDEHRRRYGPHINLLRPSEITAAFEKAGLRCRLEPVSVVPEALAGLDLHTWWAERFAPSELAVRTAIVAIELEG
jgi:hypothetical protein